MADVQKKMSKYIKSIGRKLNMPKDVKTRVIHDFMSSIEGRREAGQSDAAIYAELGTPKKVAAELNEQMKDYTYIKSPWRWLCLAIIICCAFSLLLGGVTGLFLLTTSISSSVSVIGGADGPTAISVTASDDYIWYQTGITALLLLMGILGFYRLSRCPRK